ncbi:MAG: 50S ribosomal protein L11 methyltransferase [Planctomycetes bacterium]|nr:50S ribosomal protein L11 methyltransferase [Planctomycetota bacterium]
MNGWRLRGTEGDLARALDLLHVHARVEAVWEGSGFCEVWLAGPLPAFDRIAVEVSPMAPPEGPPPTGLERDAVIRVGPGLVVRPPWVAPLPEFDGIELVVPRAMAFGSGEHGSTQAALRALDTSWDSDVASFADVGTGSGILLLYAARRGCPMLLGCDIDPAAVAAARELVPAARVVEGGAAHLGQSVDCVVANMTGAELAAELPAIRAVWNGRGPLVLSGLRATEVDTIERAVGLSAVDAVDVAGFAARVYRTPSR